MTDSAIASRVRKLLDKAESTSNPHEAAAFSQKAAELIARHRIEPESLARQDAQEVLAVRDFFLGRGAYVRARLSLLSTVAESHDVQVIFSTSQSGMIAHAAGFTNDLDAVEVMYNSLHQQASTQMAEIRRSTGASTQRFRRSFLFGFAERVGVLLKEARSQVEADTLSNSAQSSMALRLLERTERVDRFVQQELGPIRRARRPATPQAGGWDAGVSAADRADVGRTRISSRPAIGQG